MARGTSARASPQTQFRWAAALLCLVSLLWVGGQVNPALQLHASGPVFFRDSEFFRELANRPGGLIEYGSAWVAQGSFHRWLGAAIFTLGSLSLLGLTRGYWVGLGGSATSWLPLVPGVLLLGLQSRYDGLAWRAGLELVLVLSCLRGYRWLPISRAGFRWVALTVGAGGLYSVAGLGPALLFTVLVVAEEGLIRRRPGRGVGGLLASGLVLAVAATFRPSLGPAFEYWGKGVPFHLTVALYAFFPLMLLGAWWRPRAQGNRSGALDAEGSGSATASARTARGLDRWGVPYRPVGAVLAGVLVWASFSAWHKALIELDYQAQQQNWGEVLRLAHRAQTHRAATRLQVNRALYHTGRMGDDQFAYGQLPGSDLLPGLDEGLDACPAMSDTLLELGQVNLAEHFAHEALEIEGDRPAVLRQLARINVLKGRPRAAGVFLQRLGQIPFHRREASTALRDLETDPRMSQHEDVIHLRSVMATTDYAISRPATEELLRQLLHTNPRNRMAFEYLMAHYLLHGELEKVWQQLGRLKDLGYRRLPRHYEEALLLQQHLESGQHLDLQGWALDPRTAEDFQRFNSQLRGYRSDPEEAMRGLHGEFGSTYWYFYTFQRSFGSALPPAKP